MKILIIEDEILLANSIKDLLESKGFESETVFDGESGEEYAELGISGRSYDNYKRVLLDCIDNGFISERYEGKEKILGFNSKYFNILNKKELYYCI